MATKRFRLGMTLHAVKLRCGHRGVHEVLDSVSWRRHERREPDISAKCATNSGASPLKLADRVRTRIDYPVRTCTIKHVFKLPVLPWWASAASRRRMPPSSRLLVIPTRCSEIEDLGRSREPGANRHLTGSGHAHTIFMCAQLVHRRPHPCDRSRTALTPCDRKSFERAEGIGVSPRQPTRYRLETLPGKRHEDALQLQPRQRRTQAVVRAIGKRDVMPG